MPTNVQQSHGTCQVGPSWYTRQSPTCWQTLLAAGRMQMLFGRHGGHRGGSPKPQVTYTPVQSTSRTDPIISNYNAAFVKTNKATKCTNVVNYWTCSWPPTAIALLEISREAVKLPFSHRRAPRDPRVFRLQHDKSNHPCSQWLRFFWQSLTRHSSMQLKHMCKCVPYL